MEQPAQSVGSERQTTISPGVGRRERELGRDYAILMKASDLDLADIGIARSDVYDVIIALGKMRVQLKQMPNPARGQTDTIPLYLLNRRRGRSPWTNQESEMRSLNALSSSERACGMEHERGLRRIIEAIRRELRYRRDFRHLESMTEYELHDIGLSRSQIGHAVRRGR